MSALLLFSAASVMLEKFVAIFAALALVVNSLFDSAKTAFSLGSNGYTYASTNRMFIVIFFATLFITILSLCAVFFTDVFNNAADVFNTCLLRPALEFINKFLMHTLRFLWELLTGIWNVIIRYVWSECFSVLWDDFTDFLALFVERVALVFTSDIDNNATTILARLAASAGRVGDIAHSLFDLPFMLYSAFECITYFWTKSRISWAIPTYTFPDGSFHPAFFAASSLTVSPTNAPVYTLAPTYMPTPMPFASPPSPPSPPTPFWSDFAYEFNPRYGAYTNFVTGAPGSTSGWGRFANWTRRLLVAIQNFVANAFRTVAILIKSQRTASKIDFWGMLIVNVDSEWSLWRMTADTVSSGLSILVSLVSPAGDYSGLRPCAGIPLPSGFVKEEYSNLRFALERILYRTIRRLFAIPRAFTLIIYEMTTNRVGGIPGYDFLLSSANFQNPMRTNLFYREQVFCATYKGAGLSSVDPITFLGPAVAQCPIWNGFADSDCQMIWDGMSYNRFFNESLNFKVRHAAELFNAFAGTVYIFTDVSEYFYVASCGTLPYSGTVYKAFNDTLPKFVNVAQIIFADMTMRTTFLFISEACIRFSFPVLYGAVSIPYRILFLKWYVLDYILNGIIPITIAAFTGNDCVKGQNLLTCLVTQLSLIDPAGLFKGLCSFALGVLETIQLGLDALYMVATAVADVINTIIHALAPAIDAIIAAVEFVVNGLATAAATVKNCLKSFFSGSLSGCTVEKAKVVDWSGVNISQVNIVVPSFDLNIIMPCTQSALSSAISQYGAISVLTLKRNAESPKDGFDVFGHSLSWHDETTNTANLREFIKEYYGIDTLKQQSERKKRDAGAFNGNSAFSNDREVEVDEDSAKIDELMRKFNSELSTIKYMAVASDARVFYSNLERCYIGTTTVPSQYSLCYEVQRMSIPGNISSQDESCIAARCSRIALDCLQRGNKEKARRLANPNAYNAFQDSTFTWPLFSLIDGGTWIAEAATCHAATPLLARTTKSADTTLKMIFSVLGFIWDSGTRIKYIADNYAGAYYSCLDETKKWAYSHAIPSNVDIVEHYVRCLEAPYMTENWTVPVEHKRTDRNIDVFGAYLDSQKISSADGMCNGYLRRYGLLFDDDSKVANGEQLMYRACAYMHAFGTRATLATHLVAERGVEALHAGEKIDARTPRTWTPLPARSVGNYLNLWRAPISAMRSSEFLATSLYDLFDSYITSAGSLISEVYHVFVSMLPDLNRMARRVFTDHYAEFAALIRVSSFLADTYDELLDPRDFIDRLKGRSDKLLVLPSERAEVAARWHKAMRADIDALLSPGAKLNLKNDLTYEHFRSTGLESRRVRSADVTVSHEPAETFDGVDVDGIETFTIYMNRAAATATATDFENQYTRKEESFGTILREFSAAQLARLTLKLSKDRVYTDIYASEAKYAAAAAATTTPARDLFSRNGGGERPLETERPVAPVRFDIIASRSEYASDHVRIDVRIAPSTEELAATANLSAAWTYVPFSRIDLTHLSAALQTFIEKETIDESFAQDINDAERVQTMIANIRGPGEMKFASAEEMNAYESNFIAEVEAGVRRLPTPWEVQMERRKNFTPISTEIVGSVLTTVATIADRRLRMMDLPPVQAAGMLINALSERKPDLLAGWLAGRLGYVNGIGFVPRMYYEQYMQDTQVERERQMTPYAFLMSESTSRSSAVSQVTTPFFLPSYASLLRSREETKNIRSFGVERAMKKYMAMRIMRAQRARSTMLHKHGHFVHELNHGDERTFEMTRALAPHIHDKAWTKENGVDVAELRRVMSQTKFATRTEAEHEVIRQASVVVVVDGMNQTLPTMSDFVTWVDWVLVKMGLPEDSLRNFLNDAVDALGVAADAFVHWEAWPALSDYISSFICTVPDDYAVDGTGVYGWGCVFQLYAPERAFQIFKVWPTNLHNGDISWPDEAFVGGVAVNCDGSTVNTPSNTFTPDIYCPNSTYVPIYEDWSTPDKWICTATRASGKARMCLTAGLNSPTSTFPFCPVCEYCVRNFESCVDKGYGIDPIRVLQVYTFHLKDVWDEIFDVKNDLFSVLMFIILMELTWIFPIPNPVTLPMLLIFLFYGAIFSTDAWFYTAALCGVLFFIFNPLTLIFYAFMLFRKLWYYNPATFNSFFDTAYGDDPMKPPYYDPFHAIGDLLRWIADLRVSYYNPISWIYGNQKVVYFAPWLYAAADEFQLFKDGGVPTVFENICSAYGIWSIVALVVALLILFLAFAIGAGLVVSLISLAIAVAMLVFTGVGYGIIILFSFVYLLFSFVRFGPGGSEVSSVVGEVKKDINSKTDALEEGEIALSRRQTALEEEVEQLRRGTPIPVKSSSFIMENAGDAGGLSFASSLVAEDSDEDLHVSPTTAPTTLRRRANRTENLNV